MIKILKRKNPIVNKNDILNVVDDYKLLKSDDYASVYKIIIRNPIKIGPMRLFPGKYIYKIEKDEFKNKHKIRLSELSELHLIPKIYLIHNNYYIQEYIDSISLRNYLKLEKPSKKEKEVLFSKILRVFNIWHSLGYGHGDINSNNIVIDSYNNPHFIDPFVNPDYNKLYYLDDDDIWIEEVRKEIFR